MLRLIHRPPRGNAQDKNLDRHLLDLIDHAVASNPNAMEAAKLSFEGFATCRHRVNSQAVDGFYNKA